jgi:hypothetical protein
LEVEAGGWEFKASLGKDRSYLKIEKCKSKELRVDSSRRMLV